VRCVRSYPSIELRSCVPACSEVRVCEVRVCEVRAILPVYRAEVVCFRDIYDMAVSLGNYNV
jgi:hypothetical protein